MGWFERLAGIIGTTFQLDKVNAGPLIKNDGGAVGARNAADAVYVNVRGADPSVDDDLVTRRYFNANGGAGSLRVLRYSIGTSATQDSTTTVPAGAYVYRTMIEVTTPYSAGATISVGQSGSTSLLAAASDSLATAAGTYDLPQDTAWGASSLAVRTTIGGTPAAGAGVISVYYVQPVT